MAHLTRRALVATAISAPCLARAQANWPTRPVRIVSAGQAGSISDIFVRLIENRLRERLGQPIVVESIVGAGGMNAAGAVSRAGGDGHTYFVSNIATNAIGVSMYKKLPFDPKTELPPVAMMASVPSALVVKADGPYRTVEQFAAFLRQNPDRATYGSAGAGTSSHLAGVLLGQRLSAPVIHVAYRGTGPNVLAVLRGEVAFSIYNVSIFIPSVKEGTLRFLAVASKTRLADFPDVPTFAEAGLADFEVSGWYGLSAATGTPDAILDRMSKEVVEAVSDPAIAERFRQIGAEAFPLDRQAYIAFIDKEARFWAPLIASSGVSID